MSAQTHTPGPWKRGDCDNWIIWAPAYASTDWKHGEPGPEAVVVCVLDVPAWSKAQCSEEVRVAWLAEADATAALIAAAPDMLEALKALSGHRDYDGKSFSERMDMAFAAIAKARPS